MTEEMEKLRRLLDQHSILWEDKSDSQITRTHFEYRGYHWSVVHGFGSYGGYSFVTNDEGLLELMSDAVNGGEPVGWLTADEVMKYVVKEGA